MSLYIFKKDFKGMSHDTKKKKLTQLTVVIRDDTPLIYAGDRPSYRTVTIPLTEEQQELLCLYETHSSTDNKENTRIPYYEEISLAILE